MKSCEVTVVSACYDIVSYFLKYFLERKTIFGGFHFELLRDLCGVIGYSLKTTSGVKDSSVVSACYNIISGTKKFFH